MNTNCMAKHYSQLTADERFRLILAAVSRGDDAEKNRLMNGGQQIQQTILDTVPYVHAFMDLQNSTYIELLAVTAHAESPQLRRSSKNSDAGFTLVTSK